MLGGVNETDQTTTFYGQGPTALNVSAVAKTAHFESRSNSTNGTALHANVPNGPGTGVLSYAPFGIALDADGAVVFRKAAGVVTFPEGSHSIVVKPGVRLTKKSAIIAQVNSGAVSVERVQTVLAKGIFVIVLTGVADKYTRVGWVVLNGSAVGSPI